MGNTSNQIRAGAAFVEVTAQTDKAKKDLAGFKGTLDGLKKGLGEESAFGGMFKIFKGAGAVAGLALASRLLSESTGKAAELVAEFRDGQKSAGDIAEELWQSTPILGDIRKAGLNIRELWDDQARSIRHMTENAEALNLATAARKKLLEDSNKLWERQRDFIRDIASDTAMIGKKGGDRDLLGVRLGAQKREADRTKYTNDYIAALRANADKAKGEIRAKMKGRPSSEVDRALGTFEAEIEKAIKQARGGLIAEIQAIALNQIAAEAEISKEQREAFAANKKAQAERIEDINDETKAIENRIRAANALTPLEEAELERMNRQAEILRQFERDTAGDISDALREALTRRRDSALSEAALPAVGATLDDFFAPMEAGAALDDFFGSVEAGAALDSFFGPMEEEFDRLRGAMTDLDRAYTAGTFNASEAAGFGGGPIDQIAKNTRELANWARRNRDAHATFT